LCNKEQSQEHLRIFERLTREDHSKERARLQESLKR
jgi:hypothetical protein